MKIRIQKLLSVLLVIAAVFVVSCSGDNTILPPKLLAPPPSSGQLTTLTVNVPAKDYPTGISHFGIFVDNHFLGTIKPGKHLGLQVTVGIHSIVAAGCYPSDWNSVCEGHRDYLAVPTGGLAVSINQIQCRHDDGDYCGP